MKPNSIYDLNPFARAYVAALYFADCGEGDQPPADAELSPEALESIAADCAAFEQANAADIGKGCTRGSGEYTASEQAGHDFYLTRNGHGAGFWDGDWQDGEDKSRGERLSEAAHAFGGSSPYLGDDGKIYLG